MVESAVVVVSEPTDLLGQIIEDERMIEDPQEQSPMHVPQFGRPRPHQDFETPRSVSENPCGLFSG